MQTKKIPLTPEDAQNLNSIERSINARSLELGKMVVQVREMESGLAKLYDFRRELIQKNLNQADIPRNKRAHVTQTGPAELTVLFLEDGMKEESGSEPEAEAPPLNSESG